MSKFLFLTGVGRSGTTVFRTSMGLHRGITYNGKENNIVQDILDVAERNCTQPSRKLAMAVNQNRYDGIFRNTIQSLVWPDSATIPALNGISNTAALTNNSHAGSAPWPTLMAAINIKGSQLGYLLQVFPDAKVVCLVRNGVEVISSRMRYESFAGNSFESHCRVWNRSHDVVRWGEKNTDNFRLFRHEWFYQPERLKEKLDSLYRWLEIDPDDAPLKSITGELRHPTGSDPTMDENNFATSSVQQKQEYFQAKSARWTDWSPSQRATFTDQCQAFMQLMGYAIPWQ